MLGQTNIKFQAAQHKRGHDSRDQDRGQHSRNHDVEQIVSRVQCSYADHERDQHIDHASLGHFIVEGLAQALENYAPRQVWDRYQPNERRHQQGKGSEQYRSPQMARLA